VLDCIHPKAIDIRLANPVTMGLYESVYKLEPIAVFLIVEVFERKKIAALRFGLCVEVPNLAPPMVWVFS
jgi:hypothetical protein